MGHVGHLEVELQEVGSLTGSFQPDVRSGSPCHMSSSVTSKYIHMDIGHLGQPG